jgi:hypothetical protein
MKGDQLVSAIKDLAVTVNANVGDARWYFFGSAQEDLSIAFDIDLLVICETHVAADAIRRVVDVDQLIRPIHLSILTQAEEAEVCFVKKQGCTQII